MTKKGKIGVTTDNIFPIIKKFLYSDHEIFLRELVSNAVDATQKLKANQIEKIFSSIATFFFFNCNFIYEFLKYEGFNFLIFCYELIVSNLNKDSTDEEADNALNFMNSLMKFTTDVFFQINIELYTKEAKMLLFSIRKAITKVNFIF